MATQRSTLRSYETFGLSLTEDSMITVRNAITDEVYQVTGTQIKRPARCYINVDIVRNGKTICMAYACNGNAMKLISVGAY
jgi:hypothetical protein